VKIKLAYSKLFIRALASVTACLLLVVVLAKVLYTQPYYSTSLSCQLVETTSDYCSFSCEFTPTSQKPDAMKELKLNLKIHFLRYNGMLDKTFVETKPENPLFAL